MLLWLFLWTQPSALTLPLEHLSYNHHVMPGPERAAVITSPTALTADTTITTAILQARGRVYVHGLLSPKLLGALITLSQRRPAVRVRLLYPFTPAEFDANKALQRTLGRLTDRDLGWSLALTKPALPADASGAPCPDHRAATAMLIDKHLYHGTHQPPASHAHEPGGPAHPSTLTFSRTTAYAAQRHFLRRFSACATQAPPSGIQPYTYNLSPRPRPPHITAQLPKIPKWMNERLTASHRAPSLFSPDQPPPSGRRTDNPWQPGNPVSATTGAHRSPPSERTLHHPHQSSSPNLWYNNESYIHTQPSSTMP